MYLHWEREAGFPSLSSPRVTNVHGVLIVVAIRIVVPYIYARYTGDGDAMSSFNDGGLPG